MSDVEQTAKDAGVKERTMTDDTYTDDDETTISEWQAEEAFEDLLDEIYGTVSICGVDFDAGRAFRELDPIAFRQEMLNYYDSEGIEIT